MPPEGGTRAEKMQAKNKRKRRGVLRTGGRGNRALHRKKPGGVTFRTVAFRKVRGPTEKREPIVGGGGGVWGGCVGFFTFGVCFVFGGGLVGCWGGVGWVLGFFWWGGVGGGGSGGGGGGFYVCGVGFWLGFCVLSLGMFGLGGWGVVVCLGGVGGCGFGWGVCEVFGWVWNS